MMKRSKPITKTKFRRGIDGLRQEIDNVKAENTELKKQIEINSDALKSKTNGDVKI